MWCSESAKAEFGNAVRRHRAVVRRARRLRLGRRRRGLSGQGFGLGRGRRLRQRGSSNAGGQQRWWSHHTQVHGMFPDPNDGLRNQCQHFCWYFLPWHRMYLHSFEAICRSIIEFHRGRLWAEENPHSPTGSGTIFHFTLPLDMA